MRIGLVIETFDAARGGAEHWTYQFAHQLLALGHEVHVAARSFSQPRNPRIHAHQLPVGKSRLGFAAAAEAALSPLGLDVVHDMGAGVYGDVFQPHGGSRVATSEANLQLMPAWSRPLKRALSSCLPRYREFNRLQARQYADRGQLFIALSRMVMRDMLYYHDVPADRIRLVYNGVDTNRFSPEHRTPLRGEARQKLGVADDTLVLLIAAHNFRLKGVPALISATERLLDSNRRVQLVVAGGKRLKTWQRLAHSEGVASNVTFLGSVQDVVPLYAAADVYVQPTFYDPCSLVVLEALASGLPVITTRMNGASELMLDGVHGYVLDNPADVDTLVNRIIPLFSFRRRDEMGAAARELACKHTLARNCQQLLAVYHELGRQKEKAA